MAAATTSLPEEIGGVRNWDYRYCWLRDGALTVQALVTLGSTSEAEAFLDRLHRVVDSLPSPELLRPLYSLRGTGLGPEETIESLSGYAGSRPVRVGNLVDTGISPLSVAGADGWVLIDWFQNVYLLTAGPRRYDRLSRHRTPWTDPSVEVALETLAEAWGEDRLLLGGSDGALQTDFPTSVVDVYSDDPDDAMVMGADFIGGVVTAGTNATVGDDARVFPFPPVAGDEGSVVVAGDAAVTMNDRAATMELLRFLATAEAAGGVGRHRRVRLAQPAPDRRRLRRPGHRPGHRADRPRRGRCPLRPVGPTARRVRRHRRRRYVADPPGLPRRSLRRRGHHGTSRRGGRPRARTVNRRTTRDRSQR